MLEIIKKNKLMIVVISTILVSAIVFCITKYGFFIDEIFTLGCSNSHYAPFVNMLNGGNINNSVLNQVDFLNYLTVDNNEVFDVGSVFYNLSYDTQPPLYFLLLNFCSSFFPGVFSKWIGLGLNVVLFGLVLFFFYKTCVLIKLEKNYSIIALVLFGLSYSLISNMLNIRMYILFTLLSMVLVYLYVLEIKTNKKYIYFLIALTTFFGAMTQYIFLVFAFFMCICFFVFYIKRKAFLSGFLLAVSSLIGVILLLIVFPSIFKVVFSGGWSVSGGGMIEKLLNIKNWFNCLISGSRALITGSFIAFSLLTITIIYVVVHYRKIKSKVKWKNNEVVYFLAIAAFATFSLVSLISPSASNLNYISNIVFIIPLLATYFLKILLQSCEKNNKQVSAPLSVSFLVLMMFSIFVVKPGYINGNFRIFDEALNPYYDSPCVYYQMENNGPPVSQDIAQLVKFEDVFITDGKRNDLVANYLESRNNKNLIVYIDATEKSGFSPNSIINYYLNQEEYDSYKLLYKYECSECYMFAKV